MPSITQTCRITGKPFIVNEWEQEFLRKMDMPLPTLCIEERHRRRLAHRNERRIYKDQCDLTRKPIISVYSAEKPFKVYSQEAWWGDGWDGRDYGRDYDFSRPFFEQFKELRKVVPRLSLLNTNAENSEYCNLTTDNKNCYLVFGGDFNEDAMYSIFCFKSKDLADTYWVIESELIYESVDCVKSYNLKYSQNSQNCRDSAFLFECRNVENSLGCVGLRNKRFHIFNKPYSKEDYETQLKNYRLDAWSGVQRFSEEFERFKQQFPLRHANIINAENVRGDRVRNTQNADNCFDVDSSAQDLKDIILGGWGLKDSMSSSMVGHNAELFYEMIGSIGGTRCACCSFSWNGSENFYCDMVTSSQNLFGCTGLKRAEYCILNKQYSKEDYFSLRARIVEHMKSTGEWGEFFPIEDSLFAYNETVANAYFPLTKEEVLARGLQWKDEEKSEVKGPVLPDSIHDVTESILQENLVCERTGRPYRIIGPELKFYQRLGIPLPRFAPETRNEIRFNQRNPIHTWGRQCSKCNAAITTSISPDRPEKVYCESCYLAEVY